MSLNKMPKLKNINYLKFRDFGEIDIIKESDINSALNNIKGKNKLQGRALLIILYFSGARPNEVLNLKGNDVNKVGSFIFVRLKGSKKGLPRTIQLRLSNDLVKEFYNYCIRIMPLMWLFYDFRSYHKRIVINKKGNFVEYISISDGLRYHINKWFNGVIKGSIPPYFLRHSRLSSLSEKGVDMQSLRMFKGAKTYDSITPYLHMSGKAAREIAKKLD